MEPQVLSLTPAEALEDLLKYFEIKGPPSSTTWIAAILRRLCGFMCPCSPSVLVHMACKSLSVLPIENEGLRERVASVLEDLIVCGDVLELAHIAIQGGENHPRWLYCAPPSFVQRGDRVHIFGIAADDARFLPNELRTHVKREGALRFLEANCVSNLVAQLTSVGLREVSSDAWLTKVPKESSVQVVRKYVKRLEHMGVLGELPDKSILLPATALKGAYRSRWVPASKESGNHIVRVPQPYGEPLWYFCELEAGVVQRSLLLPLKESSERASDTAWRLQLALDAEAGYPATYSVSQDPGHGGSLLNFNFPLPLAARRRLLFLGGLRKENNPYQFWLPAEELALEQQFLREHYWFEEHTKEAP